GAYHIHYNAPFAVSPYPWESSLFVGRAWSFYAAADPCCNTSGNSFPGVYPAGYSSQLTQRWRFGLTEAVPVNATIAVVLQVERDIV
ncbi:MAG: hypothetical protein ACREEZ_01570, partial [Stellaceae bacterium]